MTSLARGLAVIRGFSQQRRKMSIAQLSMRTGIPRAAVRRCLYTLMKLGYVSVEEGGTFALRPQILSLGHAYLSSVPLVMAAQPVLDSVSATTHESCSLAIMDGDEILYVGRSSSSTRIMSIDLGVGSRLPAHCTSMGRVLLASLPHDELDDYLRTAKLEPWTDRTITDPERLRKVLDETRQRSWALVDQELEIGLRSVAAPIRRGSDTIAALNVSSAVSRVSLDDLRRRILPPLIETANTISNALTQQGPAYHRHVS